MKLTLSEIASPLGKMLLVTDHEEQVRALEFEDRSARLHRGLRSRYPGHELLQGRPVTRIAESLNRYFDGELGAIDSIPTATPGTDLEHRVWDALRLIPAGSTKSYGALARALGYADPRMAIDVGAANGANPIAIVVPCHRVVGSKGELKGYAWGLERKLWLLEHEGAAPARSAPPAPATAQLPGF